MTAAALTSTDRPRLSHADAAKVLRDVADLVPGTRAAMAINMTARGLDLSGLPVGGRAWLLRQREDAWECSAPTDEIAALDLAIEALS